MGYKKVVFNRDKLYEQVWEKVSRVAGGLRQLGAGPEKLIGLRFPKSIDYVLAVLGCWWAGAAYVPLDSGLPEARLQAYQAAARPDLVIHQLPWGEAMEPCAQGELAFPLGEHAPARLVGGDSRAGPRLGQRSVPVRGAPGCELRST